MQSVDSQLTIDSIDGHTVRCGVCGENLGRVIQHETGLFADVELIYGYAQQVMTNLYRMGRAASEAHKRTRKRAEKRDSINDPSGEKQRAAQERLAAGKAVPKKLAFNLAAADRPFKNRLGEEMLRPNLAGFIACPESRFIVVVCAQCG